MFALYFFCFIFNLSSDINSYYFNRPQWDESSIEAEQHYNNYYAKDNICIEGDIKYKKAKPATVIPTEYEQCILNYSSSNPNTYYWKYIHSCRRSCIKNAKISPIPDPPIDFRKIIEVEDCINKYPDCEDSDSECLVSYL